MCCKMRDDLDIRADGGSLPCHTRVCVGMCVFMNTLGKASLKKFDQITFERGWILHLSDPAVGSLRYGILCSQTFDREI